MPDTTPVPKVLLDNAKRFPALVGELLQQVKQGLPCLDLSVEDQALPKKKKEEALKALEKDATPRLRRAIALAIEDGDENKADDIVTRLDHVEDGAPAPLDNFKDLLITAEQLSAATIPLQVVVQMYLPNQKLFRSDVADCKSVSEVISLVLGTASGRL